MKFPRVDLKKSNEKVVSVFKEEGAPTIIYLPLIQNTQFDDTFDPATASFCGTFNFLYTEKEYNLLTGLTEFNMQEAQDTILAVIKECIESKI
jgi:hypothetical protein